MNKGIIEQTAKLYERGDGPLKNRCFNDFYSNYKVKQHDDEEKKAEATRLLAMGINSDCSSEKSKKLYDHYTKKSPQRLEIEMSRLYDKPLESCRPKGYENDLKASNRRVFIKGRVENLCKVFQNKMEILEKTLPESRKNAVINQIHGAVMQIKKKVESDNAFKTPNRSAKLVNDDPNFAEKTPKPIINKSSVSSPKANAFVTPKSNTYTSPKANANSNSSSKYNIKKTDIIEKSDNLFLNSVTPKLVNKLVKDFNDKTPKNSSYNEKQVVTQKSKTTKSYFDDIVKSYTSSVITSKTFGTKKNEAQGVKITQSIKTLEIKQNDTTNAAKNVINKVTTIHDEIKAPENELTVQPIEEQADNVQPNAQLSNVKLDVIEEFVENAQLSAEILCNQEIGENKPTELFPDQLVESVENVANNLVTNEVEDCVGDIDNTIDNPIECEVNDISNEIENISVNQANCATNIPKYNNRYDMTPMSDVDLFEDLIQELDKMIINQADEETQFNLSDDEEFVNTNSIDHQFAWFFKAVSNHVLSKPDNEEIDEYTKEQLDWFLA